MVLGFSCALCTVQDPQALTIHHIDHNNSNNTYENTIVLCHNCHQRHHQNKGIAREQIAQRKKHLIHKTVTVYGVNAMKIAARNGFRVALPFFLYHLVTLGYMTKEESQMGYGDQEDATARFAITDKGREVLSRWLE
jgi:hypothetical protein